MSAILSNRRVILLAVVVAVLALVLSLVITRPKQKEESPMATEIFGVKIEKNPPESRLVELGVRTWRTYVSLKTTFTFCLFSAFFPFTTPQVCWFSDSWMRSKYCVEKSWFNVPFGRVHDQKYLFCSVFFLRMGIWLKKWDFFFEALTIIEEDHSIQSKRWGFIFWFLCTITWSFDLQSLYSLCWFSVS